MEFDGINLTEEERYQEYYITARYFDFQNYIDDGVKSRNRLAKASGEKQIQELTNTEKYAKIIEYIGHLTEEVSGEVRAHVKRRPWKVGEIGCLDCPHEKAKFVEEMADVLLFFREILAYADVSGAEFINSLNSKIQKNQVRKDHLRD